MTLEEVLINYRLVLKKKYERMDVALEAFRRVFPGALRATGLPMPIHVPRPGVGSAQDIVTAVWKHDEGKVCVEWTTSINGFHFSIREAGDPANYALRQTTRTDYAVEAWFTERAHELATSDSLSFLQWRGSIYTY